MVENIHMGILASWWLSTDKVVNLEQAHGNAEIEIVLMRLVQRQPEILQLASKEKGNPYYLNPGNQSGL